MIGVNNMKKQGSGWKGESRRHSLARKGVKTAKGKPKYIEELGLYEDEIGLENMPLDESRFPSIMDFKEMVDWFVGSICKTATDEEKADPEDWHSICSLKINKILYHDEGLGKTETVIDGEIAGVKGLYYIDTWAVAGDYWQPPDAELDWMPLDIAIANLEKDLARDSAHHPKYRYKDFERKRLEIKLKQLKGLKQKKNSSGCHDKKIQKKADRLKYLYEKQRKGELNYEMADELEVLEIESEFW